MNTDVRQMNTSRHLLGDAAMVGVVVLAMVRCFVAFRSVASFGFSLGVDVPVTEVGPIGTAIFDALGVVMLVAALGDRLLRGVTVHAGLIGVWIVGVVVSLVHVTAGTGDPAIAGNWIAALALGLAALHLADVPRRRRFMATAFAAGLASLTLYACMQYFIQHPRDVRFYEMQKDAFLQQRGWEPGSIQQTKWETRLYQREATGRFGLANVFGTVVATLAMLAAGLAWAARGNAKPQAAWRGGMAFMGVLGFGALGLTFSKGAAGALMVTLIAIAAAAFIPRTWWRRTIAIGAVAVVIGIVIVRGLIGPPETAEGERSLLFRAFYWQAAATMLREQPLLGVGPGEFQRAYMTAKNPLSPEDVADPHNVFVNDIASLGVGGVAWVLVFIAMLWMAATVNEHRSTPPRQPSPNGGGSPAPPPPGEDGRGCFPRLPSRTWAWSAGLTAAVLLFGFQLAVQFYEMALPEISVGYLLGLLAFVGLTVSLDRIDFDDRRLQLGLLAAALLVLVHSQIEMSLSNTMSAPMLCAILGLAAARLSQPGRLTATMVAVGLAIASLGAFVAVPVYHTLVRQFAITAAEGQLQSGDPGKAEFWVDPDKHVALRCDQAQRLALWAMHQAGRYDAIAERSQRFADRPALNRFAAEALAKVGRTGEAIAAAGRLLAAAPYSVTEHLFAADLAWSAYRRDLAAAWYRRTLELNDRAYLDPDAQLSDEQLEHIRRRLAESPPG